MSRYRELLNSITAVHYVYVVLYLNIKWPDEKKKLTCNRNLFIFMAEIFVEYFTEFGLKYA